MTKTRGRIPVRQQNKNRKAVKVDLIEGNNRGKGDVLQYVRWVGTRQMGVESRLKNESLRRAVKQEKTDSIGSHKLREKFSRQDTL